MLHKCLKITQNVVAIEHLNIDIFHQFFVLLKVTCLVTLFDCKQKTRQNGSFLAFLTNHLLLKM